MHRLVLSTNLLCNFGIHSGTLTRFLILSSNLLVNLNSVFKPFCNKRLIYFYLLNNNSNNNNN